VTLSIERTKYVHSFREYSIRLINRLYRISNTVCTAWVSFTSGFIPLLPVLFLYFRFYSFISGFIPSWLY